jgi:cytochrome c peroxidase
MMRAISTGPFRGDSFGFSIARVLLACAFLVSPLIGCQGEMDSLDGETSQAESPADTAKAAKTAETEAEAAAKALASRVSSLIGELPASVPNPENVSTPAKIDLGRMLYYEPRLSKNHDISCNSCHLLDNWGVDNEPTSPGHRGARGDRNSPTVYNAALHIAQFWDGRAPDVEAQAKGPVLNPVEMASLSEEAVVNVLKSIPGYVDAFAAAFPDESDPVTYDNMAKAIGVFERQLMTPGRIDAFAAGDLTALNTREQRGLKTFMSVGCQTCHMGPAIGGQFYRKLGFIFPYPPNEDVGREKVTGSEANRYEFKVPSLRNVAKTAPYFHDGSVKTLGDAVKIMGYHQLGLKLDEGQIADLVAFLESLTSELPLDYIAMPKLPENGPDTPAPDPS